MLDGLNSMGPVFVEADPSVAIDGETHPGAPTQPVGRPDHLFDHYRPLVPRQPPQLLGHQGSLQRPLGRHRHMLEVAPPASIRSGMGTWRCHPIWRCLEDLHRIGPEEGGGLTGDVGQYPFTGQGVPHKHHPAVVGPGHAPTAGGNGVGVKFHQGHGVGHSMGSSLQRTGGNGNLVVWKVPVAMANR